MVPRICVQPMEGDHICYPTLFRITSASHYCEKMFELRNWTFCKGTGTMGAGKSWCLIHRDQTCGVFAHVLHQGFRSGNKLPEIGYGEDFRESSAIPHLLAFYWKFISLLVKTYSASYAVYVVVKHACALIVQYNGMQLEVTFLALACSVVSFDAMDVSGEQHLDVKQNIFKKRLDAHGKVIEPAKQDSVNQPTEIITCTGASGLSKCSCLSTCSRKCQQQVQSAKPAVRVLLEHRCKAFPVVHVIHCMYFEV